MGRISALLPAAIACIALAAWFVLYFCAMQPKSGTLEWIAAYDRAPFTAFRRWERWTVRRLWPALLCALLSTGSYFLMVQPVDDGTSYFYRRLIWQAVGTVALYLLLLQLDTPPLPAALTAVAVSTFLFWDDSPALLLLSILFLHRWATQSYDRNVFLLLAQGFLSVALLFLASPSQNFLFLLGYLLVFCIVLVQRYRADGSILHLLRTVLLAILVLALSILAAYLRFDYAAYHEIYPQFFDGLWASLQSLLNDAQELLFSDLNWVVKFSSGRCITMLAGLLSLIAVWIHALWAKDFSALLLGIVTTLAIPTHLFFTDYTAPICLLFAACIGCTAGRLYRRGKRVLSLVLPAVLLVSEWVFAQTVYTFAGWLNFLTLHI